MTAFMFFCLGVVLGLGGGYALKFYQATILKKLADDISPPKT